MSTIIKMESCSWPENENLTSDRQRAISELVKGRETTLQLQNLINKSTHSNGSVEIIGQDLVLQILNSFLNTLSILKNGHESDEVSQVPTHTHLSSPHWDAAPLKSEDSQESSKSTSTIKDRRGSYKRRKCSDSWTTDSPDQIDDGHAWRKYGQKVILNARYPRNYFRCTHKHDQGCQATKQVQRIEDNPPLFRSTYYGHHTCKNFLKATQLMLDSTSRDQASMISFGSPMADKQSSNPFLSSFSSMKQENKDETPSDHLTHNQSSSSDYLLSPDLTTFESTGHMPVLSSDHGDMISGVNSSCTDNSVLSLDIRGIDVVDSVNLEFGDVVLQDFEYFS